MTTTATEIPTAPHGMIEVSKERFYAAIGPLNVSGRCVGNYPYTYVLTDQQSHQQIGMSIPERGDWPHAEHYFLVSRLA